MKRQHPTDPDLFWCSKCETYKDRSEFYRGKSVPGWCISCVRRKKREKKCIICGSVFLTYYGKYCSDECRKKASQKQNKLRMMRRNPCRIEKAKCAFCGKDYEIIRGAYVEKKKMGKSKYCSDECRIKYNSRVKYTRNCIICGQKFRTASYVTKTCSDKCRKIATNDKKIERKCPICGKSRLVYEQTRQHGDLPTDLLCERCSSLARERNKRKVDSEEINDNYIKDLLRKQNKIISSETIEFKRHHIIMQRTLKQFKKYRKEKENESDHTDVQGKQQANEQDYERRVQTGGGIFSSTRI